MSKWERGSFQHVVCSEARGRGTILMQWQGGPLTGGLPSTDITAAKTEEPRTDEYLKGSHFSVSQHLPVVLRISN